MGNCLNKHGDPVPDKELETEIKPSITVLTFSGPQSYFESFQQEHPPTFSDPEFFSSVKKNNCLNSMTKE